MPLTHSSTPSRGRSVAWVTWAKLFTREGDRRRPALPATPYTTPEVPAVAAISPGDSTFSEKALLGWSPAR